MPGADLPIRKTRLIAADRPPQRFREPLPHDRSRICACAFRESLSYDAVSRAFSPMASVRSRGKERVVSNSSSAHRDSYLQARCRPFRLSHDTSGGALCAQGIPFRSAREHFAAPEDRDTGASTDDLLWSAITKRCRRTRHASGS